MNKWQLLMLIFSPYIALTIYEFVIIISIIYLLQEQLTCPSCKVKRKDAVLTKCFHVFCLECLKTRYETRQRKCPKCNAGFGANDYHRLYLT